MFRLALLTAVSTTVSAVELTPDTWDANTAGKSVFIKFLAPWCGHCKSMKPDWDKLMKEFKNDATRLIADVDCTAAGQPLCETHGVRGYPTLKHGDPAALEDYKGGRDFKSLKAFAEGLKPLCSPFNIDLCDEAQTKKIEEMGALGKADLEAKIKTEEAKISDAEKTFKAEVEKLQKQYQELSDAKDKNIEKVKSDGLGLMKAVAAKKAKDGDADKEEL